MEKKVDGYSIRYVYDGAHVIAEYDGNNNLLRKYIYGPGIDQPVSMIYVADANATYYYHFDALGSVVALSNAAGDTVQTYEYSVYGEVAVEDANHPNPYMFAGVRFDIEIGLYYNRARYYNPFTGRFLQTDPIGYGDGMNLYQYCANNPLVFVDPFGRQSTSVWGGGIDDVVNDACDSNDRREVHVDEEFTYYTREAHSIGDVYALLGFYGFGADAMDLSTIVGNFEPGETKMITIGVGTLGGTTIYTLDGVGLLDEPTLNSIIKGSVAEWNDRKPEKSVANYYNLWADCDTWFHYTKVQKWLYDGSNEIYDNDDINYILEGHAMARMGMTQEEGKDRVRWWKNLGRRKYTDDQLSAVFFWWEKGFNGYSYRSSW